MILMSEVTQWKVLAFCMGLLAVFFWLCAYYINQLLKREEADREEYGRLYRQLMRKQLMHWELALIIKLLDKFMRTSPGFRAARPGLQGRVRRFRERMQEAFDQPSIDDLPKTSCLRRFKHDDSKGVKEIQDL